MKFKNHLNDNATKESVSSSLNHFMAHLLRGTKDSNVNSISSIAQLIMFNITRTKESTGAQISYVRHPDSNKTPLPIYVGLLLHAHYRDRHVIDSPFKLGLCIGYHRVLTISAALSYDAVE